MAFRVRRHQRYELLRRAGFLPFEARPLSRIPTTRTPYMGEMIKDRLKMRQKAIVEKTGQAEWERRIKGLYDENKWLRAGVRRIERDPWKMLRDYEDRWRDKQPEYESPWEKRGRKWKDFQGEVERTIAKQRARAA